MSNKSPLVALYLRSLLNTGIEPMMLTLAKHLIQQDISVDFVLNKVDAQAASRIPSKVRVIDLQAPRLPIGLPRLINYLQQEQPQALLSGQHLTNEVSLLAKCFARVSTRFVVVEHSTASVEWGNHPKLKERLTPLFIKLAYPWADGIVAVSQGVGQDLAQVAHLPSERIQVIYNPVITPELLCKATEPLEHPWFQQGEPPVILGVGRLTLQKDFSTLIKAFEKVRLVKSARLMILGNGPERQKLKALIKELGLEEVVAMEGYVENPFVYMKKAKVFVLSSAWEGLPTVLIEAMAVGSLVVATDCKSGPAEILDGGKYGDLVPVGDVKSMTDAILRVLSGNYKVVDLAWLDQFSPATVTKKYIDILNIKIP
ncbi:MAG: glycosyltransferase [Xenococcaceae cyanobacterium MO_188.B29]|nr:glycosyltransferase [Xenococcaceae cyanobacterium MO_188.B29]